MVKMGASGASSPLMRQKRTFVLWLKAVTLNPRYPLEGRITELGEYDFRDLRAKMQERLSVLISELGLTREDEKRLESEENLESEESLPMRRRSTISSRPCRDFLPNRRFLF